jgi:hypothetical protein
MARIPEDELTRLKQDVSVERLVEDAGIGLKRAGKDGLGCCPFHPGDTASLVVTPAKNLWHCFGCGIGGGPIDWVMKKRGVSFRHAVELLREGASVSSLAAQEASSGSAVKRNTVRALAAPVAFDADDAACSTTGGRLLPRDAQASTHDLRLPPTASSPGSPTPLGHTWRYLYDAGHVTTLLYDGSNLVSVTDALTRTTTFGYDAVGRWDGCTSFFAPARAGDRRNVDVVHD